MWSERKQETTPTTTPIPNPENRAGAAPQRPSSTTQGIAVIGKAMVIKGQIKSREDLHVEGHVDGSVELRDCRLTVGPNGRVGAGAKAREVEVLGIVNGDVDASKKITIRKGGRLVGDLRTPGIVIEDGAYFKGRIEIVNSEEPAAGDGTRAEEASA
jgi:cytoskeletal protein CcmA (bactofilin family)